MDVRRFEPSFEERPQPSSLKKFARQYELVEQVKSYHSDASEKLINGAYVYALQKHGSQKRASGDPYFSHPVAVAMLLADLKLDEHVIAAGLLHDTVEDTDATIDEIKALFGKDVSQLVDGVTKLGRFEYMSAQSKQAENFQKFILATTKDIRVLLVKLADRLHNMRTISFMKKEESRLRIARETLEIYAPLARRIGLQAFASELEDLSFAEISPQARSAIQMRMAELSDKNAVDIARTEEDLRQLISGVGVPFELSGRRKQPYSVWRKLERKDISFRDVADIFAFRVVVPSARDCYVVLGEIHAQWTCLADRFRDYISAPKPNGYQSLHTTVTAAGNRRIEIQIRTEDMHATARYGVAAHWGYKNSVYGFDSESARYAGLDAERTLTAFAEMLEHGADPEDFFEHAKLEMYPDSVFAFTPKGRLIRLPSGAMPLDFAYAVHTALGDTCIGAKINGETRPLRTKLNNGDVVEIIRSNEARPLPGWEALTATGRAKLGSKRLVRQSKRNEVGTLGRNILFHALHRIGHELNELDVDEIARRCDLPNATTLFQLLGSGDLDSRDVLRKAFPGEHEDKLIATERQQIDTDTLNIFVTGPTLEQRGRLQLCGHCHPLPGDRIVGVQLTEGNFRVHAIDCHQLEKTDTSAEWLDLGWTKLASTAGLAVGRLSVTASHQKGVLASLCKVVADAGGNITGIETENRSIDFIDLIFDIEVCDLQHLTQILSAMRSMKVVDRAERTRS